MNLDFTERYRYLGPPPEMYRLEETSSMDIGFLKDRMRGIQSLRVRDLQGNFDQEITYREILSSAWLQLPRKRGYQYVLNIIHPQNPRLELVPREQELPNHYRTSRPSKHEEKQYERSGKEKKRGFQFLNYSKKKEGIKY